MHRVSDVLKIYWPKIYATQDQLDAGSFRHDLIEHALWEKDYNIVSEDYKMEGLAQWLRDEVVNVLYTEAQFSNNIHGYIGHPDAVLETRTYGTAIFDWKSNEAPTKGNLMQAQAYHNLTTPIARLPCHLVHLCGETVKVTRFAPDAHLWVAFTYGLKVLQMRDYLT